MNFNSLCDELGINSKQTVSERLALLKQWFQKTVSRDLEFTGNEKEQFNEYKDATETYLELMPQFSNANMLSTLASMGFDQVISSIKPTSTQLDIPNNNGLAPLHLAALAGNLNTTQILLNLGANPNILNKQKQYPLFSALVLPILHSNRLIKNKIAIFKLLSANHKLLRHQDDSGNTVVHQMAIHNFSSLMAEVLKIDAELAYIQNNLTHYPIHSAILNNQTQNIKLLLEIPKGALLSDKYEWCALHYAARYSTDEIIELCCQASPNKDAPDYMGKTPLILASELGRLSAVQTLIAQGAQINLKDPEHLTALDYAKDSGNTKLVNWLNKQGNPS
jgi:ankyrin repeat protein